MGMMLKFSWNIVFDRAFDRIHVFSNGDAGAVSDPENMRINRLRGHAEPHVQNDIRGLAPNTGQRLKRGTG